MSAERFWRCVNLIGANTEIETKVRKIVLKNYKTIDLFVKIGEIRLGFSQIRSVKMYFAPKLGKI